MKKLYILFITLFISASSFGQFTINEVFVGNGINTDGQFVEISGPANTLLTDWSLEFYDVNGSYISMMDLTGETTPSDSAPAGNTNGMSVVAVFNTSIPQNGGGVALIDNTGTVVEFFNSVSFFATIVGDPGAGPITASGGTADGMISDYIDLFGLGFSNQKTDAGWISATPASPDAINDGQTLSVVTNEIAGFAMYPNPVTNGQFYITSPNRGSEKLLEIFSVSGNQVYKNSVKTDGNIDISNLIPGIYMVRVEEEGKIATRKLIVN